MVWRAAARRTLVGSEVPGELALFTAVEGGVVEEGAGGAVPLQPLVLLLVCDGLHNLTARVCDDEKEEEEEVRSQKNKRITDKCNLRNVLECFFSVWHENGIDSRHGKTLRADCHGDIFQQLTCYVRSPSEMKCTAC